MINAKDILQNIARVIGVTWISAILVARVYDFHLSYLHIIDKTKKEEWLLDQCKDHEFFHNLAVHSGSSLHVCAKPRAQIERS